MAKDCNLKYMSIGEHAMIFEFMREIRNYRFVKSITFRPVYGYAVIYLDIRDKNDVVVLEHLKKLAEEKYNLLVSLVIDKKMMIIREVPRVR